MDEKYTGVPLTFSSVDLLRSTPYPFAAVGNPPEKGWLFTNGFKGKLAANIGIRNARPAPEVLRFSEMAEDYYKEETGGGSYVELFPRINNRRSLRPFPVEAALIKAMAIDDYMKLHKHEPHGIHPVVLANDVALTLYINGNSYAVHKPVTAKDRETQIELFKRAASNGGVIGYQAGLCTYDTRIQQVSSLHGVETLMGKVNPEFNPEEIMRIQEDFSMATGGMDFVHVLEHLTLHGSPISITHIDYSKSPDGNIKQGSVLLNPKTSRSIITHSSENFGIIPQANHGFLP